MYGNPEKLNTAIDTVLCIFKAKQKYVIWNIHQTSCHKNIIFTAVFILLTAPSEKQTTNVPRHPLTLWNSSKLFPRRRQRCKACRRGAGDRETRWTNGWSPWERPTLPLRLADRDSTLLSYFLFVGWPNHCYDHKRTCNCTAMVMTRKIIWKIFTCCWLKDTIDIICSVHIEFKRFQKIFPSMYNVYIAYILLTYNYLFFLIHQYSLIIDLQYKKK